MRRAWKLSPLLLVIALSGCKKEKLCPSDQALCSGTCTAIATDPASCGACGHACGQGETCTAGHCICSPDGRVDCAGSCVDLSSDPANCGACGVACGGTQLCTTAANGATACADACAQGIQTACGQACVDLQTDRWSCGACGRACGTNERCSSGRCAADLYLACFNSNEVREATRDLAPAGIPLSVAAGPGGLAWVGSNLFVYSSAYGGVETLSKISLDPPAVRAGELFHTAVASPDFEYLAAHDGLLFLSHASVGTLLVVTPDGKTVDELPLAPVGDPDPNPYGIAFLGEKAYLALNARNEVVVLDVSGAVACASGAAKPPCLTELARIDVQPLASAGALAKPSRVAVAGGRVYVTLWNLDASFAVPPGSTGRLAAIDPALDALDATVSSGGTSGLVDLGASCLNATDLAVHGATLYVSCGAYDFSVSPPLVGNGIAQLDLSGSAPAVGAFLAAPADAAPGKLAFCGDAGYVADRNTGRVFRLDPVAGAQNGVELCPPSGGYASVFDIACGP